MGNTYRARTLLVERGCRKSWYATSQEVCTKKGVKTQKYAVLFFVVLLSLDISAGLLLLLSTTESS
jgi:hypothetical protein